MSAQNSVQFITGKKKTRGELRLPQIHFVFCLDWDQKVGQKALFAWLKFYTWADRSNSEREVDIIPSSINKIAKRLGVGKTTLYDQIIKPLWNHGLIDLQEYHVDGNVYVNIIVYEYPQNDPSFATLPLEKVRDYDQDYLSNARKKSLETAKRRAFFAPTQSQIRTGVVLIQDTLMS